MKSEPEHPRYGVPPPVMLDVRFKTQKNMKIFISFLSFLLLASLPLSVYGDSQAEETAFLTALKSALEKKDAAALIALHCWDGMEGANRQKLEKQLPEIYFQNKFTSAEYVPPIDPPAPETHDGKTYTPNLKPEKAIFVKCGRGNNPSYFTTCLWLGRKDGQLFIILASSKPTS